MLKLLLLILVALLSACGSSAAPPPTEPPPPTAAAQVEAPATEPPPPPDTATPPPPTATTAPPTETPTLAPSPTETTAPPTDTPTPAPPQAMPDEIKTAYLNLMMLEIIPALTLETANQRAAEEIDGMTTTFQLIAIASIFEAASENYNNEAAPEVLAPAWAEAQTVAPQIQQVIARWFNQEITAPDVPAELAALEAPIAAVLASADEALTSTYNLPPEALTELRAKAVEDVKAALKSAN